MGPYNPDPEAELETPARGHPGFQVAGHCPMLDFETQPCAVQVLTSDTAAAGAVRRGFPASRPLVLRLVAGIGLPGERPCQKAALHGNPAALARNARPSCLPARGLRSPYLHQ